MVCENRNRGEWHEGKFKKVVVLFSERIECVLDLAINGAAVKLLKCTVTSPLHCIIQY